MKRISPLIKMVVIALLPHSVMAYELAENVQLHGFASQGYVYSPDNEYAGKAPTKGSFDFRELGANLSWNINDKTRISGQVIKRQVGDAPDEGLNLDFFLADHRISQTDKGYFGIRLGRVKNEFGLYNAVRDIPNARPGLNVPESVYFESFRDAFLSVDGVNLYASRNFDMGQLDFTLSYGTTEMDSENLENYVTRSSVEGDIQPDKLLSYRLNFQPAALRGLEVGFSQLRTVLKLHDGISVADSQADLFGSLMMMGVNPFDPTSQPLITAYVAQNYKRFVTDVNLDANFSVLSLQYAFADWILSAEAMRIDVQADLEILGETVSGDTEVEGFFIQAEWFPLPKLATLVRYEELDLGYQYVLPGRTANLGSAKGVTLGAKWHFDENWSLGVQLSQYNGYAWAPAYEDSSADNIRDIWKVYRAGLTYQF